MEKIDEMCKSLQSLKAELKAEMASKFTDVHRSLNDLEQYQRNWSLRINFLKVPAEDIKSMGTDLACMSTACTRIIKPVLEKAIASVSCSLVKVPSLLETLSTGHFVYNKKEVTLIPLPQ